MEDFILNFAKLLFDNSDNISIGVIVLVAIILLAAMVFAFVHIGLKVAKSNSEDRAEERAADNSVIDRLFATNARFIEIKDVLENLNQQALACQEAYAVDRQLNEEYLTAIRSLNESLHSKMDENAVLRVVQSLQKREVE